MRYLIILLIGLILLSGCNNATCRILNNDSHVFDGRYCVIEETNQEELLNSVSDDVYIEAVDTVPVDYFITIECTDTPVYLKYEHYQVNTTIRNICDILSLTGGMKNVKT